MKRSDRRLRKFARKINVLLLYKNVQTIALDLVKQLGQGSESYLNDSLLYIPLKG